MPTVEERLAVIEAQNSERLREEQTRRTEVDRRLTGIESNTNQMVVKMAGIEPILQKLLTMTHRHVTKETCINGGAKILQGGGAAGGIVIGLVALIWALKQLGLL